MSTTVRGWLCDELRRLAGFDEVEEMADYLLSFPADDAAGLSQYLGELLGVSSETEQLARDLVAKQSAEKHAEGARVGKVKKKSSSSSSSGAGNRAAAGEPQATTAAATSSQAPQEKRLSQKERARLNRIAGNSGGGGGGGGYGGGVASMGGIKVSYKSSNKGSGSSRDGEWQEAEAPPQSFEQAAAASALSSLAEEVQTSTKTSKQQEGVDLVHGKTPGGGGVVVNCLACGYVNVISARAAKKAQQFWGNCSSCARPLERGAVVTEAEGFRKALELKDRLVRYDAESIARTAVYDDESDYYTSAAWLSELEQEELRKRDAKRHARLHGSRSGRDIQVSIDLAGRRVVEENDDDTVEAARARFMEEEKQRRSNVEDLKELLLAQSNTGGGGGSAAVDGGGGGSGGGGRTGGEESGGGFFNDTLTGRSAEVMATLDFGKMKKSKGGGGKEKPPNKASSPASSDITAGLTQELAPWRAEQQNGGGGGGGGGGGSGGAAALSAAWKSGVNAAVARQQQNKRRNVQSEDDISVL